MHHNVHPKSYEKGKFRVAKFSNKTTRLIHQMWDKMATVIIIKKDNKIMPTFEVIQVDVESSSMIRTPKKQNKEATIEEKKEKAIDNLIMKKYLGALMRLNASLLMNQLGVNS
jgi:hypothetical protein